MRAKRKEASEKKKRNSEMENVRNWAVAARWFHQYNQRGAGGVWGSRVGLWRGAIACQACLRVDVWERLMTSADRGMLG